MPGLAPTVPVTNTTTAFISSPTSTPPESTSTSTSSQNAPLNIILPILFGTLALLILLLLHHWYRTRPKKLTTDTEVALVVVNPTSPPASSYHTTASSLISQRWKADASGTSTPSTAAPLGYYTAYFAHSRVVSAAATARASLEVNRARDDDDVVATGGVNEAGSEVSVSDGASGRPRADSEVTLVEPSRRSV